MIKDKQSTHGQFRLQVINDGKVTQDTGWRDNLGTTARLPVIAGLYGNTGSQTAFTYLAVGTSSTAVSAGHTALQAEIVDSGLERASATVSRTTTNSTNDSTLLSYTWSVTGTKTIEEIGYFNAASSGTMGGRALTTSMAVVNGSQLVATYKIIHT